MYMSAMTIEMRLAHAEAMWRRFRPLRRCQIACRVWFERVHEKQSRRPPTRWRSEWHDEE